MAAFAWIWSGCGWTLSVALLRQTDLTSWALLREPAVALGTVERCWRTGASVGGSKHSQGTPVYGNTYRFRVGDTEYTGRSYETGSCFKPGEVARVEYSPQNPTISRLQGMRRAEFGPEGGFVGIFLLLGVGFVGVVTWQGLKRVRLLERGVIGWGRLVSKTLTSVRINNRPLMRLAFALRGPDGREREVTVRTHLPERLEDEAREPLLYDPDRPDEVMGWDLLGLAESPDEAGELRAENALATVLRLIPPTGALLGLIIALTWKLG
jgi:hypothetical protein